MKNTYTCLPTPPLHSTHSHYESSYDDISAGAFLVEPILQAPACRAESARGRRPGTFHTTTEAATKRWETCHHGIPEALRLPM